MATIRAMYVDLTDSWSALAWAWLQIVDPVQHVEIRPFCLSVRDPWGCTAPPLALELLMLLEQAREQDGAMHRVLDAAFARVGHGNHPSARDKPDVALATWLAVWSASGLSLDTYDADQDRLRAEVGYWQVEAIEEFGITDVPTLLADDGTTMQLRLEADVIQPVRAGELWQQVQERLDAVSGSPDR